MRINSAGKALSQNLSYQQKGKSLPSHPFYNHFFLANNADKDLELLVHRNERDLKAMFIPLLLVTDKEVEAWGGEVASEGLSSRKWPSRLCAIFHHCRPYRIPHSCPGCWPQPISCLLLPGYFL